MELVPGNTQCIKSDSQYREFHTFIHYFRSPSSFFFFFSDENQDIYFSWPYVELSNLEYLLQDNHLTSISVTLVGCRPDVNVTLKSNQILSNKYCLSAKSSHLCIKQLSLIPATFNEYV